jgi:UDP-N-acetylmuramyl pentapeptide phosphotransferase/UDP-N-acetylglucosamine-1-phosphate transferase
VPVALLLTRRYGILFSTYYPWLRMTVSPFALPLIAFMVTLGATCYLVKGRMLKVLDQPNFRSLHSRPVPRTGGLGLMCGILFSWMFLPGIAPLLVWISVVLLVTVSFADDVWGLSVWVRLMTHVAVAVWFSIAALADSHGWAVAVAAAVAITWMINLYNFMDGSDGLAGGMALIGFSCYGIAAWSTGNESFAIINFCIGAAAAAFLLFNFHPARIFMGDAGSIPLGFLAAVLGMTGWADGIWPFWFPLLAFSPFIVDASVTLAKRGLRGEKVWEAHREHYYQRMVQSGLGHRNTAVYSYILMLGAGASAIWAMQQPTGVRLGTAFAWAGIYLVVLYLCDRYWERHSGRS